MQCTVKTDCCRQVEFSRMRTVYGPYFSQGSKHAMKRDTLHAVANIPPKAAQTISLDANNQPASVVNQFILAMKHPTLIRISLTPSQLVCTTNLLLVNLKCISIRHVKLFRNHVSFGSARLSRMNLAQRRETKEGER